MVAEDVAMVTEDAEAKKKAEAAALYKKFHQEELEKNGGDAAAAAACAIVRLKEKTCLSSAPSPPAAEDQNTTEKVNGNVTEVDVVAAAPPAAAEGADGAVGVTNGSPTAAELRERRLQALEEAQAQKKQQVQTVSGTTFQRSQAAQEVNQPANSEAAPQTGGQQSAPTASAAELRERRLQALEANQQQSAKALAAHQTSSGGFKKREWDSVNVLNNTSTKMGESVDKADQQQEEKAPELPKNLTGMVLSPQGFDPPPRTENASTTAPSIVGGVLVKKSVSGLSEEGSRQASHEPSPEANDEDDDELKKALAMSLEDDAMGGANANEGAPPTPTAQKRKLATEPDELEALAKRLETSDAPNLEDVSAAAESLRETAKKIRQLEATAMHFAQTLQVVQMVVARSGIPGMGGESEGFGASPGSPTGGFPFARSQPEENTKSYLFKRGEQREEEAEPQAARTVSFVGSSGTASSPTGSSGTPNSLTGSSGPMTCGGSGSAGQTMSREEMDKQRKERLQRLESQQAEAKKEKDAMEAKARARDAMFNAEGPKKR